MLGPVIFNYGCGMASPSIASLVTRIDSAAEAVCARDSTSPSRARQVRWVAGELKRALEHPAMEALHPDVPSVFTSTALDQYLTLARDGELRVAPYRNTAPSPASERVRLDCLGLLAVELGTAMPALDRPAFPTLREPVATPQQRTMWERLEALATRPWSAQGRVRLLAMMGVVLDTGARAGELCSMHVDDLAPDLSTIRFHRRPQARRVSEPTPERLPLSPATKVALRRWLDERHEIVSRLQGAAVTALWVSVRGNHVDRPDGTSLPRPAGMPLQPRGLRRAYERAVNELNTDLAGTPGWTPLPSRLEQLRRGVPVQEAGPEIA